ncbi:GntR family transcriptional regulator [Nocardioides acrostichi]|uniref:GntR family transcriptional regulator n=1 Tax=Nocardioides acrostichi TaxID=2784339 RepID=A0A930Y7F0_9ACTN|nr:GntR family transcriptional regulator [Nocardioides acrostichi]MBF4161931.1 GntR family transcriptional regulator [Nocardioides acrostichi]
MSTGAFDDVLSTLDAERRARRTVMSTTADRVAGQLREQVAEGHLRSGTKLPEERLAAALGVSRNTLREALGQLVAERILVREAHRGVVVSTPDADDVRDVYAARLALEPGALRQGEHAPAARVAALRAAVEEGQAALEAGDHEAVGGANQHFHHAVVALAGSDRLDAQMDLLLAEMRLFFHAMGDPRTFHEPYLAANAAICDLAEAGRWSDAAEHLTTYLTDAREQLLGGFALT